MKKTKLDYIVSVFFLITVSLNAQTKSDSIKKALHEHPQLKYDLGKSFTIIGEVGARLEYISNERFAENEETADDDNRFRERVRLRLGSEFRLNKTFSAGFRLSTGQSSYPASGWSSFSDNFSRDPIAIDRLYINLNFSKFRFLFGANKNAMFHPTEMVWDGDVQPAGFVETYNDERFEVTLGQYMLREVRDLNDSKVSGSFLIATGINYAFMDNHNLRLGLFNYYYSKPDAIATAISNSKLDGDFKTNRLVDIDETKFFSDYNIVGFSGDYHWEKWRIVSEIAVNIGAKKDSSLGAAYASRENVAAGGTIRYGVLKDPGDWSIEAGYFYIEADAVMAAYNSDDYQQTNVRSVPVWLRFMLPGNAVIVWDTYFQKRIENYYYLSGGVIHDENALKIRSRITLQLGF